jgi:uncharacterized protein (DUF58 family)
MFPLSEVKGYLMLFAILFILGLFLTSRVLLIISFFPLFIYLLGLSLPSPKIKAKRTYSKSSATIGETIDIQATGMITGSIGTIIFYEKLPEPFELVDGSNYKVVWKGFGTKKFGFSYKARCTKRGDYYFKGVEWEFRPLLGLKQPIKGVVGEPNKLTVSPRIFDGRKIRIFHKFSLVSTPLKGIAKLGTMSTDFREIRQYTPGDPFKLINWKATAKTSTGIKNFPLINEYEREGKACVWIFLDAHKHMRFGTSIENAFEHGIEAAINLINLFLNKGFLLGMYVYNDLEQKFYPDVGKQQYIRIAKQLLKLYSIESDLQIYAVEGLSEAIGKNRKLLTSLSPLVIVITHLTQNNIKEIIQGIKKISGYTRRKYWAKTLIINVLPYDLIPKRNRFEELSAQILEAKSKSLSEQLRMLRAVVLDWNPRKENFGSLLIKHLRLLLSQ